MKVLTKMKTTQKPIVKMLLLQAAFVVSAASANTAISHKEIDKLTQTWITAEQSTAKLKSDWMLEKQLLQQRISILKQQNKQLTATVNQTNQDADELTLRRQNLLSEQQAAESQLANYKLVLPKFTHLMQSKAAMAPNHIQHKLQDTLAKRSSDKSLSANYQILVDGLKQLHKNDQLLQVKQGMISLADRQLMTEQLYLGNDQAWFSSPDNSRVGIGYGSAQGWVWQELTEAEISALGSDYKAGIAQAIKDAKHLTPGRLIELPVKLGGRNDH